MLTEKTDWEYSIGDVHLTGPLFPTKEKGNIIRYDLIEITYDISFFVVHLFFFGCSHDKLFSVFT